MNPEQMLKSRIQLLELEQAEDARLLKEQFTVSYESLKPANLLKNMFHDIFSSSDVKADLANAILGVVASLFTQKTSEKEDHKDESHIWGTFAETVVAGVVAENMDEIEALGKVLLRKVFPII